MKYSKTTYTSDGRKTTITVHLKVGEAVLFQLGSSAVYDGLIKKIKDGKITFQILKVSQDGKTIHLDKELETTLNLTDIEF